MTRARVIHRPDVPDYFHHVAGREIKADPVIHGGHLALDPRSRESLRDPFRAARHFAGLMAALTGEPFAWGWYETTGGATPGVCPKALAAKYLRIHGDTTTNQET